MRWAKDEPIETRWPTLKAFYEGLERTLHAHGISSLTTGGNACIVYGLAQMTKDCDIIIPIEKAEEVLQILAKTTLRGNSCTSPSSTEDRSTPAGSMAAGAATRSLVRSTSPWREWISS